MGGSDTSGSNFRRIPAVTAVIEALKGHAPEPVLVEVARRATALAKERAHEGLTVDRDAVIAQALDLLHARTRRLIQPVINGTGVLIHTNLGRVPLGRAQLEAIGTVAGSYTNLEYDIEKGERGTRYAHAGALLTALTGAESGVVVNNNAAAVLLVLASLCREREVIVSRGELIEIGSEFRLPDIMAASGARLVEVGTTNRTHLRDYEEAITPGTAAVMKVHPSNYRLVGFTATVAARDLARLARGRGVPLIHDLGSGMPDGIDETIAGQEPSIRDALEDGADIVTFSGDKLLGGPQAGIILGRTDLVARMTGHPLIRALRVDKLTLAALQATLSSYLEGRVRDHPLWELALAPTDELETRARFLAERVTESLGDDVKVEARPTRAVTGGGSLPGAELPSWGVYIVHQERSAAAIHRNLRFGSIPVIARIDEDQLVIDLRAVPAATDETLRALIVSALGA